MYFNRSLFFLFRDSNICPIDHEVIEHDGTYPDRAKEREILMLACFCTNAKFGCGWQGSVKLLEVLFFTSILFFFLQKSHLFYDTFFKWMIY